MTTPRDNTKIEFRSLTKKFPGVTALREVSFDIRSGELHAIVGENGAGKSTLMKCLSGAMSGYDGEIHVDGRAVSFAGVSDAQRAGIGIIHQELNLVDELSVAANVFLGRELRGRFGLLDDRAMERTSAGLLAQLECEVEPRQRVGGLRVGDRQLVEIAKAMSLDAEILIMDEPTSALTETESARLFRVIDRLRARGVTVLYISHKMDEVFLLADRITVLRDGRLVRTIARSETTPREITHLMVGRAIEEVDLRQDRTFGETLLEVRGLSLPWRGHARAWRLRDINLSLRRGEIVGLAGLMGAGRTELLECLFGCSPEVPSGQVFLEGRLTRFRAPSDAIRAGVVLVPEDRKSLGIFANLDVCSNMTICNLAEATHLRWISRDGERAMAQQAVQKYGVKTPNLTAAITSLSGGNQQKVILGRWLLTRPRVLLLDDPARGVDVGAKAELYRLIDGLCRDGLGIIVTSSELPELLTLCDRIVVLCEGRITGEVCRGEATESRIMELATQRR